MKPGNEWQVCDLEHSKKLKELGVKQESVWWWVRDAYGGDWHLSLFQSPEHFEKMEDEQVVNIGIIAHSGIEVEDPEQICSAFTVAELGEMLPPTIGDKTWLEYTHSTGSNNLFKRISYAKWVQHEGTGQLLIKRVKEITFNKYCFNKDYQMTEANARAKMVIWLIENGHLKVKGEK